MAALFILTFPTPALMSAADVQSPEIRFHALVPPGAAAEKLAGGFRFLEGPAWHPTGAYLLFSDIPAGKVFRFDASGVSVWRDPSQHSNGNFFGPDGTLYTCEHGARRVTRTSPDGEPMPVAETFEGKPLNSPNDLVVQRDGTVWFTDPTYGLEGRKKEQRANFVFRLNPATGELRAMAGEEFGQPNGLCFSPDERRLYVGDSDEKQHLIRVYDVAAADGTLSDGRVFCTVVPGVPDGMRCDRAGNLWTTAGDGVHVYSPEGELLGCIPVPETPANLCFGGLDGDELFVTARTGLYRVRLPR